MKEDFNIFKNNIRGKKVVVLGMGVSNRPLIRYIANIGAIVTACDKMSREALGDVCNEFESMGVKLQLGAEYLSGIGCADIIFRTPSLRPDLPELVAASAKGAFITSEIEEFVRHCPADIIGVTGSDGKTTTTTIIHNILKEEGYTTWLGGNIGFPLFDKLDSISSNDKVVLELSSFQLMTMNVSPDIAVVTNLSPNHLDIHKSMEEYIESKKNVLIHQGKNGLMVLNLDNDITRDMEREGRGKASFFSRIQPVTNGAYLKGNELVIVKDGNEEAVCYKDDIKLPGLHNIENMLAAFAATARWCSIKSMRNVAAAFTGVEHRIEYVREIDGIKFYNGSIASSPTRTIADLNSFDRKVILIAGGYDKKIPFDELAQVGVNKVKLLILIGATAHKIEEAFNKEMAAAGIELPVIHGSSLEDAVITARNNGKPGDIVTLSPACASFDMFRNFEERGIRFKEIVNAL